MAQWRTLGEETRNSLFPGHDFRNFGACGEFEKDIRQGPQIFAGLAEWASWVISDCCAPAG